MTIAEEVRDYIKKDFKRGKVACLTGAGISYDSGIPTFRGKGGLWEKYDPEVYAYPEGLKLILNDHPQKFADFIADFYSVLLKARPSPGHTALAALEKEGILSCVITQNIDNLHQSAGSRNVIELHGNAFIIRCMKCAKRISLERERLEEMARLFVLNRDSHLKLLKVISRYFPRCSCGRRYRIDVVLFGEELPREELYRAYRELEDCRSLLIVGSSLVVYPAADLPIYAKSRGVKLIEVNNEPSSLSDLCDYKIMGRAAEVLPEFLRILES
jgi:NAD-dependent deacetylase